MSSMAIKKFRPSCVDGWVKRNVRKRSKAIESRRILTTTKSRKKTSAIVLAMIRGVCCYAWCKTSCESSDVCEFLRDVGRLKVRALL